MTAAQSRINVVTVMESEYVPLPNTPHYVLPGPGRLEVTRHPDGRLSAQVLAGTTRPLKYALAKKLTRLSWGL